MKVDVNVAVQQYAARCQEGTTYKRQSTKHKITYLAGHVVCHHNKRKVCVAVVNMECVLQSQQGG